MKFRSLSLVFGLVLFSAITAYAQSADEAAESSGSDEQSVQTESVKSADAKQPASSKTKRYKIPGSDFPIALGVEIPAGKNIVFLSGMTGPVVDADAPEDTIKAYGDTETQTVGALERIQKSLKGMGLTMGDIVKLRVFMVGDPNLDGKMDFSGMMAGYTQFFATDDQPNVPARSAIQVAGLAGAGRLIEIEATAVRP